MGFTRVFCDRSEYLFREDEIAAARYVRAASGPGYENAVDLTLYFRGGGSLHLHGQNAVDFWDKLCSVFNTRSLQ